MSIEKFGGKDPVETEWLKEIREKKLEALLDKQEQERQIRPQARVEELTNAEVAELSSFKDFCVQLNIVPTKRQAGKCKEEFMRWLKENKTQEEISRDIKSNTLRS